MKTTFVGKMTAALVALGLAAGPALAEGQVNILTWEGYADPSFIKQFETESGCKVSATYVGSNDDFASKLAAGGKIGEGEIQAGERCPIDAGGRDITDRRRGQSSAGDDEFLAAGIARVQPQDDPLELRGGDLVARGLFAGAGGAEETDGNKDVPCAHDALVFVAAPGVFRAVS